MNVNDSWPVIDPASFASVLGSGITLCLIRTTAICSISSFVTLQALIRLQVKPQQQQQQIYGHLGAARALSAHGESSGKTGIFVTLRFNYPIREVLR